MAHHNADAFTGDYLFIWSDDPDDDIDDEQEFRQLGKAVAFHDHSEGLGFAIARWKQGVFADRPDANVAGEGACYVALDTKVVYWSDGVDWHGLLSTDLPAIFTDVVKFDAGLDLKEIATPAAPPADYDRLYAKANHQLYFENSDGDECVLVDGCNDQDIGGDKHFLDDVEIDGDLTVHGNLNLTGGSSLANTSAIRDATVYNIPTNYPAGSPTLVGPTLTITVPTGKVATGFLYSGISLRNSGADDGIVALVKYTGTASGYISWDTVDAAPLPAGGLASLQTTKMVVFAEGTYTLQYETDGNQFAQTTENGIEIMFLYQLADA